MAADTKIQWASKVWNPILGCTRVSRACDNCYAVPQANIRASNPHPAVAAAFAGLVIKTPSGLDWTGQINLLPERLTQPLRWKKPQRIFVNSLSDLFHSGVPVEYIAQVWAVMALAPQHTFLVLTKRHGRMRSVLSHPDFEEQVDRALLTVPQFADPAVTGRTWPLPKAGWPLPNVHLGVSVEDQKWADIRIPALLATPAAVRWISAEPLTGPIDLWGPIDRRHGGRPKLNYWLPPGRPLLGPERTDENGLVFQEVGKATAPTLDWVVAGGESGPKATPSHPDWFRTLRDQCAHSGTPFFFKQWGDWGVMWPTDDQGRVLSGPRGMGMTMANDGTLYAPGDLTYPDGPRYGEAVRADHGRASLTAVYRVGKRTAGRELDGRLHDDLPKEASV
jgi:protein gp37